MYQRFKDAIITPAKLVDYRNDKLIGVFAYILFFALLLSTRMIIDVITYDGLSISERNEIMDTLPALDEDCGFTATRYECSEEETTLLYNDLVISYYLDSHTSLQYDNYETQYSFVIQGDSMYVLFNNTVVYEELLADLPGDLMGTNFSLQTTDEDEFEERIFSTIDEYVIQYRGYWGAGLIAIDFLTGVMLFFAFILLSAFMMRLRFREIPYRHLFIMTAYSSTALYLILIFNSLFQLNFLLVFLLIIIAFRQNSQLSFEILKRLRGKQPKDNE